jgi:protein-S-isoprenylcysteine O-methyltransferase Ste14
MPVAGPSGRPWAELGARALVGTLFLLMSINLLQEFLRTYHLTGLLLLVSEALVVVFTIIRRPAQAVDRSAFTWIITGLALIGPPLLRAGDQPGLAPDYATAMISAAGVSLVIVAKLTLGRSFGIVPANRGVVATGPYRWMRHPIYTGYIVSHLAFVAAHPRAWNIAVLLVADTALILRALLEERVLNQDETYRAYCSRVGWHLVPGVF